MAFEDRIYGWGFADKNLTWRHRKKWCLENRIRMHGRYLGRKIVDNIHGQELEMRFPARIVEGVCRQELWMQD